MPIEAMNTNKLVLASKLECRMHMHEPRYLAFIHLGFAVYRDCGILLAAHVEPCESHSQLSIFPYMALEMAFISISEDDFMPLRSYMFFFFLVMSRIATTTVAMAIATNGMHTLRATLIWK